MSRTALGWSWVAGQGVLLATLLAFPWQVHGVAALTIGLIILAAGVALAVAAFRTLGSALTPTPVPVADAGLRMTGVYAWIRHPIYTAILISVLGLGIAAGSWALAGWLILATGFFLLKSRWEDRLLREKYGTAWESWASRTGALLPSWRTLRR